MQTDGNLVVYNSSNFPLWVSHTGSNSNSSLKLQNDGNLVIYSAANTSLWANYAGASWLEGGQTLHGDQSITSPNGQYKVTMQTDGNLVQYAGSKALWSSNTQGSGNKAVMQTDGNFVVYTSGNTPLWTSGTGGNAGARLAIQSDGNLVVYPQSGTYLWANHAVNDTLDSGTTLTSGQSLQSANKSYRVVMQSDGNLVQYNSQNQSVWQSSTQGGGNRTVMQTDGNFVVYNPSNFPLWTSGTGGNAGARAVIQNDGNLVVYSTSNWPLWVHQPSQPGTPATGNYPDDDAIACGHYMWCKNGSWASARTYAYRNCTDYAAWKVLAVAAAAGAPTPSVTSLGHAKQWAGNAQARGITVDTTPSVGSVAATTAGESGHVAYVEAVNGNNITISEYNYMGLGSYHTRTVLKSSFTNYIHF